MTKDGSNARKKAARELAAAEQITCTEALRRAGQHSGPVSELCQSSQPSPSRIHDTAVASLTTAVPVRRPTGGTG